MAGRLLTIAVVMTLSAALAYGGQARQPAPQSGQSVGSQSSGGGQRTGGQSSGGGQGSVGGRSTGGQRSGGGLSARAQSAARRASATQPAPRSYARPTGTPSQAPAQSRPWVSAFSAQQTPSGAVVRGSATGGGQRVAQPRQSAPGPGDQSRTSGTVSRGTARPGPPPPTYATGGRYTSRLNSHHHHYDYPRHAYPYGYGAFGLGYFYYDPYAWYPGYATSVYSSSSIGGYYAYRDGYATGEVRLQVRRWDAEVYVDGYYAGRVEEFDGVFESLRIEEGPHTIEIVADGYETLVFDVFVQAGRKIELRGELVPYRR